MTPIYTKDLGPTFFPMLAEVCASLNCRPAHLLGVMMSESGVYATARNPNGNASGLIQFMPATLQLLGWMDGHDKFRQLSAEAQLPWVRAYFKTYAGHLPNGDSTLGTVAAIYTATFLPTFVRQASNPDFVLCAKDGRLGWAYGPNAVFDENHDLCITVRELEHAVARNCAGPRWAEIVVRLLGSDVVEVAALPASIDLRTVRGIQEALKLSGFDPGPLDGIPGLLTHAAVVAFQHAYGLVPDGIVGPNTRAALEAATRTTPPAAA